MARENRRFANFQEFWPYYLSQHQNRTNRRLHAIGTLVSMTVFGLAIVHSWLWIFAAAPLGYGFAWIGHYFIERTRPATLSFPLWSLRADLRLTAMMLLRRPVPAVSEVERQRATAA